jgi:hypothetical protein
MLVFQDYSSVPQSLPVLLDYSKWTRLSRAIFSHDWLPWILYPLNGSQFLSNFSLLFTHTTHYRSSTSKKDVFTRFLIVPFVVFLTYLPVFNPPDFIRHSIAIEGS